MGQPVVAAFLLAPALGLSVRPVGSEHPSFKLHRIHVEAVIVGNRAEPDVFHVVFPVGPRAPALFPLPGNPVADMEVLLKNGGHYNRSLPVGARVDRRRRSERGSQDFQNASEPPPVIGSVFPSERASVVVFGQVVRRVKNQKVDKASRQPGRHLERVAADYPPFDVPDANRGVDVKNVGREPFHFLAVAGQRPVSRRPFLRNFPHVRRREKNLTATSREL